MTTSELKMLMVDGPVDGDCPYCDQPGGSVPYCGKYLHQHCYEQFGRELEIFNTLNEETGMAAKFESVQVRTDEPDAGRGYAIEDLDGNVLGYTPSLFAPEQRMAIAKVMGVPEHQIDYKGDDEDDNGPVEVWGLIGTPVTIMG